MTLSVLPGFAFRKKVVCRPVGKLLGAFKGRPRRLDSAPAAYMPKR